MHMQSEVMSTYADNTLPIFVADLLDSILHGVKILVLAIAVGPCHSSSHLSTGVVLRAIRHPIYVAYLANFSSALNLSRSSPLKQIATAISPSSVLGIR